MLWDVDFARSSVLISFAYSTGNLVLEVHGGSIDIPVLLAMCMVTPDGSATLLTLVQPSNLL